MFHGNRNLIVSDLVLGCTETQSEFGLEYRIHGIVVDGVDLDGAVVRVKLAGYAPAAARSRVRRSMGVPLNQSMKNSLHVVFLLEFVDQCEHFRRLVFG